MRLLCTMCRENISALEAMLSDADEAPIAWHLPKTHQNGPALIYHATYAKLGEEARRDFQPLYAREEK